MTSPTEFAPSSRMVLYEPVHQISMWEGAFGSNISPGSSVCVLTRTESDKREHVSDQSTEKMEDSESSRNISEKIQRRLAQNREAARKSRLKKKAYVQQLETARLKLAQLELELEKARQHVRKKKHPKLPLSLPPSHSLYSELQQGLLMAGGTANSMAGIYGIVSSGVSAFETEYERWIDGQERKTCELRNALRCCASESELGFMVENVLRHYCDLFRMKRKAARIDAFHLVSGQWRTSVERFFLWIGGFRPSELIAVVMPHLDPMPEEQVASVSNLRHSCVQAEDALSQGMEKLQQTLAQSLAFLGGSYSSQTASALENLESLESFVHQADHLREQTLQRMSRLLSTRQAAKGLVALGEYFKRLRTLSALWTARCPREPAE